MKKTDFAVMLTRYLSEYLPGQRNVSTNTIKSYRDTFKQLLKYYEAELSIKPQHLDFCKINTKTIRDFLQWLERNRGVSINTRNQRLAAIHSFYRYTQSEAPEILHECQRILGIPFKKRQRRIIEYLSPESLKYIFEQPDIQKMRDRRDLTLLVTLYDTAARVQEIISLKVRDVRIENPSTILLTGKGNKKRCVPIMEKTQNLLTGYIKECHLLENGKQDHPLFYNPRRNPLTRPGITYILSKYLQSARLTHPEIIFPKYLHPHMMRHTKAMHLLEAGVNLIYIRDLLGHVNVTTTEIYLKANMEIKRKALESAYLPSIPENVPLWEEDKDLLNWLQELCR